jgi:two-component system sensor histidine kinase ChiS
MSATENPVSDEVLFAEEDEPAPPTAEEEPSGYWRIMLVDDEAEIHSVTRLALAGVSFRNKPLRFVSAYSGAEAIDMLRQYPDTALMLLDVVMESDHAGLDAVRQIRGELGNRNVQIILRTGQPGQAPEEKVIVDYEINDYKAKSELTARKLFTSVLTALRAYEYLAEIQAQQRSLKSFARAADRFVPKEFMRVLGKASIAETLLGDQLQQEMTILFLDVRGFSGMSEKLSPGETFAFINELMEWVCPIIRGNDGFVDKFLGDGLLALFPHSIDNALKTVLAIRRQIVRVNRGREAQGKPPMHLGMGVHFGKLMLGVIGEPERLEATVIGDAVNAACRIESLTKDYGVDALISEVALGRVMTPGKYAFRFVEQANIRGRADRISVYELLDEATPVAAV